MKAGRCLCSQRVSSKDDLMRDRGNVRFERVSQEACDDGTDNGKSCNPPNGAPLAPFVESKRTPDRLIALARGTRVASRAKGGFHALQSRNDLGRDHLLDVWGPETNSEHFISRVVQLVLTTSTGRSHLSE